jgi:hypothetical protein
MAAWPGAKVPDGIFALRSLPCLFECPRPMPVNRIAILAFPLLLCLAAVLRADTVILKSGDKLEGKILNETDTEMTISVQVTATIKDERVVKKADIDKVLKVQPDVEAWTPLGGLAPGADSLERDDYVRISAALQYFVTSFPESAFAAPAKEKMAAFAAEQKRVEEGEMKLNGQWLSKEQVVEERAQIGGRILLNRMKRAAAAGQLTEAMVVFDQFGSGFTGSASYPDAVELARQILPSLKAAVTQRQEQYKRGVEDEKKRLLNAKGTERTQLEALLKNERAKADATVAAAEKAGVKWPPLQPVTERSLTSLASRTTSEMARLNGVRTEKMKESVKSAELGASALANGDVEGAEKALREASGAWNENELAKRLLAKVADIKKAATGAKQTAPQATPTPTPAPKSKPTPSASSAAPVEPIKEDEPPPEPSLFKKPAFFIVVAAVVAFGLVGSKVLKRSRSTNDLLDQ